MYKQSSLRRFFAIAGALGIALVTGMAGLQSASAATPTTTITYSTASTVTATGSGSTTAAGHPVGSAFTWTVPADVTKVTIKAAGGNGGSVTDPFNGGFGAGGTGAVVTETLAVTAGETLTMSLGGDGPTGGGSTTSQTGAVGGPGGGAGGNATRYPVGITSLNGGGGGSSSMVALNDPSMSAANVVLVAGAGGGGPSSGSGVGGNGGTPIGGSAGDGSAGKGMGGNISAPGAGGTGGDFTPGGAFDESNTVTSGTDGVGGVGGNATANNSDSYTGGGGGGGYGGGSGGAFVIFDAASGLGYGGGGGGSFVDPSGTNVSYALRTDAIADGSIVLTFGSAPVLASTGFDPLPLGLLAATLLAFGIVAVATTRRRASRTAA